LNVESPRATPYFAFLMNRFVVFLLFASAPLAAQTVATPAERSAATHGAYTESQATEGELVFKKVCASCHELSFHTGEQFRMSWFGRNVWDLFKILKTTMPEDNIGGLTDDEYTRVITYIFKLNGFPAGADSLRADSLEMSRIRIGPITPDSSKPPRR
jgi:mono/diheme cytochrome c family protein